MEQRQLRGLLERVATGQASIEEAERALRVAPFEDLGYAKVDTHRGVRQGVSEVVYGAGKTAEQIAGVCRALLEGGQHRVLVTRLEADKAERVERLLVGQGVALCSGEDGAFSDGGAPGEGGNMHASPDGSDLPVFEYRTLPRLGILGEAPEPDGNGTVVVAAAGTSDLPVAEEAAVTAEMLGNDVVRLYDVGVAGIHRLLAHAEDIAAANVVVAVARHGRGAGKRRGRYGSVPGYRRADERRLCGRASFGGVAALLAMLNSCASGVSVVNIDNGFGAGYQAHMVNHAKARTS